MSGPRTRDPIPELTSSVNFFTSPAVSRNAAMNTDCGDEWESLGCEGRNRIEWADRFCPDCPESPEAAADIATNGPVKDRDADGNKHVCAASDRAPANKSFPFDIYRARVVDECAAGNDAWMARTRQELIDRLPSTFAEAFMWHRHLDDPTPTLENSAVDLTPEAGCVCAALGAGIIADARGQVGASGLVFTVPGIAEGVLADQGLLRFAGTGYRSLRNAPVILDAAIPRHPLRDATRDPDTGLLSWDPAQYPPGTATIYAHGPVEWNFSAIELDTPKNASGEVETDLEVPGGDTDTPTETNLSWDELRHNIRGSLLETAGIIDFDPCGVFSICVSIDCDCGPKA